MTVAKNKREKEPTNIYRRTEKSSAHSIMATGCGIVDISAYLSFFSLYNCSSSSSYRGKQRGWKRKSNNNKQLFSIYFQIREKGGTQTRFCHYAKYISGDSALTGSFLFVTAGDWRSLFSYSYYGNRIQEEKATNLGRCSRSSAARIFNSSHFFLRDRLSRQLLSFFGG